MSLSLLAAYDDFIRCSTVLAESSCEPGEWVLLSETYAYV